VLISPFGERERDQHEGIDLAAPEGTPVRAAAQGTVIFAGTQRGYGNLVVVAHSEDLVTVYAHNQRNLVKKGARVGRGQQIARVGHTGNATGPHLHFEVRVRTHPHDPLGFLR
jgi:murein DD-endopeptidase MepM/ murein hydrolase activator NlpD